MPPGEFRFRLQHGPCAPCITWGADNQYSLREGPPPLAGPKNLDGSQRLDDVYRLVLGAIPRMDDFRAVLNGVTFRGQPRIVRVQYQYVQYVGENGSERFRYRRVS